jgi:hypothetical protein
MAPRCRAAPSAEAYLSLKLDSDSVSKAVKRLRKAPITRRRANDILRAAGLTARPPRTPEGRESRLAPAGSAARGPSYRSGDSIGHSSLN